jgi:hypothetical protein
VGETGSDPPKIKVVDRRKFAADGDPLERPEATEDPAASTPPPEDRAVEAEAPPQGTESAPGPTNKTGPSSQQFLELVTLLAGQAELLLVGAEDLPAQPAEAQRMINYLGVLEEKTAGNLSDDEAKVLASVLYQLRTSFLQRSD